MELFELILLLILAVLASALIAQLTTKISAPLVQIALGVVIALFFGSEVHVNMEPELFLLLFIAPLLFNEAQHINRLEFWKNKGMILSLALGLVIVTTFAVGFTLNLIVPTIGLAVAFALGATLGPTDAVAVSSLSGTAALTKKQKVILAGESLINDASGLVAFQFAIAAAVTGTFSAWEAGKEFLVLFFGGIGLGLACGALLNFFIAFLRNRGFENDTFHVLFEVAIPFAVFLLGEELHVSGVLAVVACGIVFSISHGQAGYAASRTNLLSNSVWEVIAFALNGIVFVLLGIMLPGGMMSEIGDGLTTVNYALIGIAGLLACVVIGIRFLWCLFIDRFFGDAEEIDKRLTRHAAILSFSGAKGAITLSLIMTVPYSIAVRSELIFVASVVILITLLLANFIVPILAPAPPDEESEREQKESKCYVKTLRRVVERLTGELEDAETVYDKAAYQMVIQEYAERISNIQEESNAIPITSRAELIDLRLQALEWQKERALQLKEENAYSDEIIKTFMEDCEEEQERIEHGNAVTWTFAKFARKVRVVFRATMKSLGLWKLVRKSKTPTSRFNKRLQDLKIQCREYASNKLVEEQASSNSRWAPELLGNLASEYQRGLMAIQTQQLSVTKLIYSNNVANDIRLRALSYEHDLVNEFYERGEIDRKSVNTLRRRIAAMQMDAVGEV